MLPPYRSARLFVAFALVSATSMACDTPGPTPTPVVTVSSIEPSSGAAGVATEVRITGMNFKEDAVVTIGNVATVVNVIGRSTIIARTSTQVEGPASLDVVVRNKDGGKGTLAGAFTFTGHLPVALNSVGPKAGRAGWRVELIGENFATGAQVFFGGIAATQTQASFSSGRIFAWVPMLPGGPVEVTVVNPSGGTATLPGAFTFLATSISVGSSSVVGGEAFSITWDATSIESLNAGDNDWIGMYAVNVPGIDDPWSWGLLVDTAKATRTVWAPNEPGQYEIRYYSRDTLQASVPVTITPPAARTR
jgi:hypothetical protein